MRTIDKAGFLRSGYKLHYTLQCNFGRVIPDEEIKAMKEATNEASNKTVATTVEPATKTTATPEPCISTANTAAKTPTEPVEDDKPKLPLWKAALKQKKEAEVKKQEEEKKKQVSFPSCYPMHFQNLSYTLLNMLHANFRKKKMMTSMKACPCGKESYLLKKKLRGQQSKSLSCLLNQFVYSL